MIYRGLILSAVLLGSAQAACGNAYYPVREGLIRTYQGQIQGKPMTYTEKITKVSAMGFTLTSTITGSEASVTYKCGPQGVIGMPMLNSMPGVKVTVLKGQIQPPQLALGTAWSISMGIEASQQGQTMQGTVDMAMKVIGQEAMKVKAGPYNTLKVQTKIKTQVNMKGQTMPMPELTSNTWVAQGVGAVKSEAQGTVFELVSFKPGR